MEGYPIRTVQSAIEDDCAWVSLHYRAHARKLEVLHIACDKTIDHRIPGQVYLERYDQMIACYGGAKKIVVKSNAVHLQLNKLGIKSLMLEGSLTLVAPEKLTGWKKAIRVFQEMATYPTGHVIELA